MKNPRLSRIGDHVTEVIPMLCTQQIFHIPPFYSSRKTLLICLGTHLWRWHHLLLYFLCHFSAGLKSLVCHLVRCSRPHGTHSVISKPNGWTLLDSSYTAPRASIPYSWPPQTTLGLPTLQLIPKCHIFESWGFGIFKVILWLNHYKPGASQDFSML